MNDSAKIPASFQKKRIISEFMFRFRYFYNPQGHWIEMFRHIESLKQINTLMKKINKMITPNLSRIPKFVWVLLWMFLFVESARSQTQLVGSELTYTYLEQKKYEITLNYYVLCNSPVFDAPETLEVHCEESNVPPISIKSWLGGKTITALPLFCDEISDPCQVQGFDGIEKHQFVFEIDFDLPQFQAFLNCSKVRISARMCCRDSKINTGPANDPMYNYTELNLKEYFGMSSPKFGVDPLFYANYKESYYSTSGVTNMNDVDSISYEWDYSMKSKKEPVKFTIQMASMNHYLWNHFPGLLTPPISYPDGTAITPKPIGIFLDEERGDVVFLASLSDQRSPATIVVKTWKRSFIYQPDGSIKYPMNQISTIRRDQTFIVNDLVENKVPTISTKFVNTVEESESICLVIETDNRRYINPKTGAISPRDTVTLTWNEGIPGASWKIIDSTAINPKAAFCWTPPQGSIRDVPYQFVVSAKNNYCPLNAKVDRTVSIYVQKKRLFSIENHSFSKFNLYPNPATNHIRIEMPDNGLFFGKIFDIRGVAVQNLNFQGNENIDITALLPGMYFIQIGNFKVEKFVKM
jgi:hypothetical protein